MRTTVKLEDLELAMEYIKHNGGGVTIEIDEAPSGHNGIGFSFTDVNNLRRTFILYPAAQNTTPKAISTQNVYKNKLKV